MQVLARCSLTLPPDALSPAHRVSTRPAGHWGVRTSRSQDSLVTGYREKSHVVHSLGSDGAGLFSVFRDAQMRFGTMEMHRCGGSTAGHNTAACALRAGATCCAARGVRAAGRHAALTHARRICAPPLPPPPRRSGQSSMNLFTDIDVGDPVHALYNGGPPVNGPNSGARTVYWGITSDGDGLLPPPRHNAASRTPGNCTFGPNLVFVGVKFEDWICEDWTYEPDVTSPKDLYLAQLERRRGSSAAPKGAVQPAAEGATSSEGAEAAEPAADKLLADLLPADKPPADKPSAVELPSDEPLAVEQRSTDEPRRMLRR